MTASPIFILRWWAMDSACIYLFHSLWYLFVQVLIKSYIYIYNIYIFWRCFVLPFLALSSWPRSCSTGFAPGCHVRSRRLSGSFCRCAETLTLQRTHGTTPAISHAAAKSEPFRNLQLCLPLGILAKWKWAYTCLYGISTSSSSRSSSPPSGELKMGQARYQTGSTLLHNSRWQNSVTCQWRSLYCRSSKGLVPSFNCIYPSVCPAGTALNWVDHSNKRHYLDVFQDNPLNHAVSHIKSLWCNKSKAFWMFECGPDIITYHANPWWMMANDSHPSGPRRPQWLRFHRRHGAKMSCPTGSKSRQCKWESS